MKLAQKTSMAICLIIVLLTVCSCAKSPLVSSDKDLFYLKQDSSDNFCICYWNHSTGKSKTIGRNSLKFSISSDKTKIFFGENENEESVNSPYYNEYELYFDDVSDNAKKELIAEKVIDHTNTPDGKYLLYVTNTEKVILRNMETGEEEYIVSDFKETFRIFHLSSDGSIVFGAQGSIDEDSLDVVYNIYTKKPNEERTLIGENAIDAYCSDDHSLIIYETVDNAVFQYEKGKDTIRLDAFPEYDDILDKDIYIESRSKQLYFGDTVIDENVSAIPDYDASKKIIVYIKNDDGKALLMKYDNGEYEEIFSDDKSSYSLIEHCSLDSEGNVQYILQDSKSTLYKYVNGKNIKVDKNVSHFATEAPDGDLSNSFFYDTYDIYE